jgi:hypothetical protein
LQSDLDTGVIVFDRADLKLPEASMPLVKPGYYLKEGVEIGWLGFPAIPNAGLCFFSGRISNWNQDQKRYLVDGVAINGVSGGPAFRCKSNTPEVAGVMSAYIANRATGETLPGVAVVQDVTQFHDIAERFKSLDEAKLQESPPGETAPVREDPSQAHPETKTRV